jgi:hypothetical protein
VHKSNIEILKRFQSETLRSILNAPLYINNHRIHEDLQMNTVLSEIKKWNTKYLRKLENHTNALAVNLLDNSETTHRLKRYTVFTVPDRPEQNPNRRIKMIPKWIKIETSVRVTPLGIARSRASTCWHIYLLQILQIMCNKCVKKIVTLLVILTWKVWETRLSRTYTSNVPVVTYLKSELL